MKKNLLLILFSLMLIGLLTGCQELSIVADAVATVVLPEEVPHSDEEIFVWQDEFQQPESGWDRFEETIGYAKYIEGRYEMAVLAPDQFLWSNPGIESPQNVRVKVQVTKTAGENDDFFGVMCRYQNADNFYALLISGDGYAGIFKREHGGNLENVIGETMLPRQSVAQGNSDNFLQADCVGSHLALWVNGFLVDVAKDETFSPSNATPGDVGLIAGTFDASSTMVQFSDFQVFELK